MHTHRYREKRSIENGRRAGQFQQGKAGGRRYMLCYRKFGTEMGNAMEGSSRKERQHNMEEGTAGSMPCMHAAMLPCFI